MDKHAMSQLVAVFMTIPAMVYGHSIPEGWHKRHQNSTDSHVQLALSAINELFRNNGDSKERSVDRVLSKTIEASTEVIYRYEIEVSADSTKELCNISVLSRPSTTGEHEIKLAGPPQCSLQAGESDPHMKAPSRRRRSDPAFEDALFFLQREVTVLTNSSKFLFYKRHSTYSKPIAYNMVIVNLEFAKSPCTLAKIDETDYGSVCDTNVYTTYTAVICKSVELEYNYKHEFTVKNQDCTPTRFFNETCEDKQG